MFAPVGYTCCAETTLDGVVYARVAAAYTATCCNSYCTYYDAGSNI